MTTPPPGQAGDPADDAALRAAVAAVRAGDRDAFVVIVSACRRRLYALALMMMRDAPAAEDVTQDTLVRAWRQLDRYDESRPLYPWLAAICVRLAQDALRAARRRLAREGEALAAAIDHEAASADALTGVIEHDQSLRLWRALSDLPSGQRTAAFLYYRQDLPVRDVAAGLGVTEGTVKTLLFRARQSLRRAMTDDGDDQ